MLAVHGHPSACEAISVLRGDSALSKKWRKTMNQNLSSRTAGSCRGSKGAAESGALQQGSAELGHEEA